MTNAAICLGRKASATEAGATRALGRLWRWCRPRIGALIPFIIYGLLLIAAPTQVIDVLRSDWTEGGLLIWVLFLLPVMVAAIGHLALVPASLPLKPRADRWLVLMPLVLIGLMAARWVPAALLVVLPLLVLAHLLLLRLLPRIDAGRVSWRRPVILATLALFVVCVVAFQAWPQALPVALGPMLILTLGVALIGLILAAALLLPVLATVYLVVCLIASAVWSGSTPVPLIDPAVSARGTDYALSEGLYRWLRARKDLDAYRQAGKPYPVIIASAEGGGIYAAAHSYLALSAMSSICPNFRQHLFATVGVSGGAVGTLFYAAKSTGDQNPDIVRPCQHLRNKIDITPVTTDLLSPTLSNLLFLRTADFLIPGPSLFHDGGQTLADSMTAMDRGNGKLTAPLRASWNPAGSDPATVFVTTDVNEGNRFVLTPLGNSAGLGADSFPSGTSVSQRDIAANSAALISARFPFLTSTARLQVGPNDYRILADGGYFENSGSDTSLAIIQQIRDLGRQSTSCPDDAHLQVGDFDACKCQLVIATNFDDPVSWSGCTIPIFIAFVPMAGATNGVLGYRYGDAPNPPQSYFGDPLATLLRARGARDRLQMIRARAAFSPDDPEGVQDQSANSGYYPQQLAIDDLNLPLGWKLSRESAAKILELSAPTRACHQQRVDDSPEPASVDGKPLGGDREATAAETIAYDNGCNVRMLAWLFDPSSRQPGIGISSY
ncbi:hypothetical protein [Sphingobium sp. MK2]|uniref:hypothetical protein n=1 Tax=Sphingobium sp. MK2 TaxID=3116540 RepID=UPI0032E35D89